MDLFEKAIVVSSVELISISIGSVFIGYVIGQFVTAIEYMKILNIYVNAKQNECDCEECDCEENEEENDECKCEDCECEGICECKKND